MLHYYRLALPIGVSLCILGIAILSLIPGDLRPHSGVPGRAEHFLGYFLTAFLLGMQRRGLSYRAVHAIALCTFAGIFSKPLKFGFQAGIAADRFRSKLGRSPMRDDRRGRMFCAFCGQPPESAMNCAGLEDFSELASYFRRHALSRRIASER